MKDISDILTVSFDNGLKDESALCVTRKQDGDYSIIKMELGEQADILHYLLTNQLAKAEIKTEKWIPIKERLPEVGKEVLFTTDDGYVLTGVWDGKRYFEIDDEGRTIEISEITAWMPLPEPYKPKEEEDE